MRFFRDTGLRSAGCTLLTALALLIGMAGTPATGQAEELEYTVDEHKFKLSLESRFRLEGWDAHAGSTHYFNALRSRATLDCSAWFYSLRAACWRGRCASCSAGAVLTCISAPCSGRSWRPTCFL